MNHHPFKSYMEDLCIKSNMKLKAKNGEFKKLPLKQRLLICNVITNTSTLLRLPIYMALKNYSNDLVYIEDEIETTADYYKVHGVGGLSKKRTISTYYSLPTEYNKKVTEETTDNLITGMV